ncbi:MAG: DNA gyrase/topoisomerase IV subunit A, partial [Bacteroidales bacterium]|nr:DNA gyrase/topoisomerase IV subunit A [Bacteroidales bacterium]
ASIGDALVQIGQKELLVDTQGNWGNTFTGDSAAAPRYIEARLSKFALDVVFNPKTSLWKSSYDGRNKEPLALPVKFPLLLAMGVEGIAVGLASKILPHNFVELIEASIKILQNQDFDLYPDFQMGGLADFSKYNRGLRGGKVRVRAKINKLDKKILSITELPFGTTTGTLIDSIVAANDKGKIKIRKIDDNTAENVEVLIHLQPGVSPDTTIDALYAFTACEIAVSPNACVIYQGKPQFLGVKEMLRISTENTVDILRRELQIRKDELLEMLHFASLEKIFIEKRIYRKIEECQTWQEVIEAIAKGLEPYMKKLIRSITTDDIIRLTEIKIKRISKYNSLKADEDIARMQEEMGQVQNHLNHLVDYAIEHFRQMLKKHGKGRTRRTEIRYFDTIEAAAVAAATLKLYVNKAVGFVGWGLKKDEYVCECSDIDDVIVFRENGTFQVLKVAEKVFVGQHIIHIDVFKRNDDRTIYNMAYRNGKNGPVYVKRFAVLGITRDKEYDLTGDVSGSKVLYFTANPNGEAEIIRVHLRPQKRLKKLIFEFDLSTLTIKGRGSKGNILSKKHVQKIVKTEEGVSTLGARPIWFDDSIRRLNADERGRYLGDFAGDDKILTIMQSGAYQLTSYDLGLHFDEDLIHIEKFVQATILTAVYFHNEKHFYFVKRFVIENGDKKTSFMPEPELNKLILFSTSDNPLVTVVYDDKLNKKPHANEIIHLNQLVEVMGVKALGKKVSKYFIKIITLTKSEEKETDDGSSRSDGGELDAKAGAQAITGFSVVPGTAEADSTDCSNGLVTAGEQEQEAVGSLSDLFPPVEPKPIAPRRSDEDSKQMIIEF